MNDFNMKCHLRFVDARPLAEMLPALEEMFGGKFILDEKAKADGQTRYVNFIFGLDFSLLVVDQWESGVVYFLSGAASTVRYKGQPEVDMAFHAGCLLRRAGCDMVMTVEEYRDEAQRRQR